jgi:hypothetical protein
MTLQAPTPAIDLVMVADLWKDELTLVGVFTYFSHPACITRVG